MFASWNHFAVALACLAMPVCGREVADLNDGWRFELAEPAGTQTNNGNAVFIWKNVRLASGENSIEAAATIHGAMGRDNCRWNLAGNE